MIDINNDERIDSINENLSLIQKKQGLTFGTDAYLLYAYIRKNSRHKAADFGAGTGIISFLCAAKGKLAHITCVEIQKEFADLIGRNAELNNLSDKISVKESDVRDIKGEAFDVIFSNPPYMKASSGDENDSDMKNIARRELNGGIEAFCEAASKNIKYGGAFYCVFRADRTTDLLCAMRKYKIEPKRMTYVYPDAQSRPSIVLVEGKMGASVGIFVTAPLIMHKDARQKVLEDTEDLKYIYENGEFHERFNKL